MFQFPSNGKAYPKPVDVYVKVKAEEKKFQFPSNGKAYPKRWVGLTRRRDKMSFNSLQTGRHIQSFTVSEDVKVSTTRFQFPSNGKAYPKDVKVSTTRKELAGFNSLQTGRHIQRCTEVVTTAATMVSIPFKREGISKVNSLSPIGKPEN